MTAITIKDIAKAAGVSTATVSYVINGTKAVSKKKQSRVLEVINSTGYTPSSAAKSLRTKKPGTIGVLVEDIMAYPTSPVINGICDYIDKTNYHILFSNLRMMDSIYNRYDQIIHQKDKINNDLLFLVKGASVGAIIYVGMFDRDISGIIDDIGIPVIVAYSTTSDCHTGFVTYENEEIQEALASHIINAGHRQIAVLGGHPDTAPAKLRLKGIKKAFDKAKLPLDPRLVKNGTWSHVSGYACMKELLDNKEKHPFTAVISMNDHMVVGAYSAIREAGLSVPGDVSFTGFDNRDLAEFVYPPLTTAEIDLKAIGFAAAREAVKKLAEPGKNIARYKEIIPCKMILRDSVATKEVARTHSNNNS